jgi:hypothetical protein
MHTVTNLKRLLTTSYSESTTCLVKCWYNTFRRNEPRQAYRQIEEEIRFVTIFFLFERYSLEYFHCLSLPMFQNILIMVTKQSYWDSKEGG